MPSSDQLHHIDANLGSFTSIPMANTPKHSSHTDLDVDDTFSLLLVAQDVDLFTSNPQLFTTDFHGAQGVFGDLAIVSLAFGAYDWIRGFLERPKDKVLLDELKAEHTQLGSTVTASTIIYNRYQNYKPFFYARVARTDNKEGRLVTQHYLAAKPLSDEWMDKYNKAPSQVQALAKITAGIKTKAELLAELNKSAEETNPLSPAKPSKPGAWKSFTDRSSSIIKTSFKMLFAYGTWFALASLFAAVTVGVATGGIGLVALFVAAAVLTTAFTVIPAILRYRQSHANPMPNPEDRMIVETLEKMKKVNSESEKITDSLNSVLKELKGNGLGLSSFDKVALPTLASAKDSTLTSSPVAELKSTHTNSDFIEKMKPRAQNKAGRFLLVGLGSFVGGFMMAFVAMQPLLSVLTATAHIAALATLSLSGAIVPIVIALAIGMLVAGVSLNSLRKNENKTALDFKVLSQELLSNIQTKGDELQQKRSQLAKLKEDLSAVTTSSLDMGDLLKKEAFKEFSQKGDQLEFMQEQPAKPKSLFERIKISSGDVFNKLRSFLGGASTATAIVRIVFALVGALATLGLVANPISLTGLAVVIAFVAVGWGVSKLLENWAAQQVERERNLLDHASTRLNALTAENDVLDQQLKVLGNIADLAAASKSSPISSACPEPVLADIAAAAAAARRLVVEKVDESPEEDPKAFVKSTREHNSNPSPAEATSFAFEEASSREKLHFRESFSTSAEPTSDSEEDEEGGGEIRHP